MLKRQISARKFLIHSFLLAGVYCISIHVISTIGYITNSQWPALQLAWKVWFPDKPELFSGSFVFFNRLGSFFCEDHYVHILKLRAPLPPPSSSQGWIVSSFGFCYASPLIWEDGDLIFHFILSKIVALVGKNPAFKWQGALYFFCGPLKYRAAVWIFKSNNLEILSLFSFKDYMFCANHALLTWISSHLYFI